ncbi:NUDIX domain-containing protein [Brevibacillus massiliensis]|uniref:NUDIX domain-containing protein n=1 Tax=Brevibacillus massiliensis TaxID=1118054 RepID=UPI000376F8D9|nr:NUDIX domain-containing protein [Brevibacillus massiliensis]
MIRNSARAVIIQDDKILAVKVRQPYGDCYFLPGGGQQPGEDLQQTVRRECMEEIGQDVVVIDLLFVREYIGQNHQFAKYDGGIHQVDHIFLCEIKHPSNDIQPGLNPDTGQLAIEWIRFDDLSHENFFPQAMIPYLIDYVNGKPIPTYLGDVV